MVAINQVQSKFCSEQLKNTDIDTRAAIAFPLGQQTIEPKVFDTEDAIKQRMQDDNVTTIEINR